jgi:hypothetical protein
MSAPFVYLAVDCWRWLLVLSAALGVRRLLIRRPTWLAAATAWWRAPGAPKGLGLGLGVVAVAAVVVSTPNLRFDARLHGDEPKYIRFCESFCQGLGFDLNPILPYGDLPRGHVPELGKSVHAFFAAIPTELRFMRRDARNGLAGRTHFNRSTYLGAWFLQGKDGGLYQVHNPGLSFLLLPAYALDHYLGEGAGDDGNFPDSLRFTTLALLALYAIWTALVFDVCLQCAAERGLAVVLALTAMLTIPVAALPFQIYPETAAGLMLFVVVRYTLFNRAPSRLGAMGAGLAAAALPWLHIRFLAVSGLWMLGAGFRHRKRLGATAAFLGTYAVGFGLLSFYTYHVTGSLLPTAPYYGDQSPEPLSISAMVPGVLGELFDRDYGLFAYSPVYLLALPGIVPFFKKQPYAATLITITIGELALLSAGHSWNSAGGSPLRHLVAVMPLALLPGVVTVSNLRSRPGFWVAALLLLMFSLQNACAYNLHHLKHIGPMVDASTSGWKTLLLFPLVFAVEPATRQAFQLTPLLGVWIVLTLLLCVMPLTPRPAEATTRRRWPFEALVVAGLLATALVGTAVGVVTGTQTAAEYSAGE